MANLLRYCLVGLLLVSPLSFAGRTIIVEPHQVTRFYEPGQGPYAYSDSRNWNQPISTQNGRINVPVNLKSSMSWATFRAKAASLLKLNPGQVVGGAVVAGALAAVDWLFDPQNNSLQKKDDSPIVPSPDMHFCPNSNPSYCNGTAPHRMPYASPQHYYETRVAEQPSVEWCGFTVTPLSANSVTLTYTAAGSHTDLRFCGGDVSTYSISLWRHGTCPSGSAYDPAKSACVSSQQIYVPVEPADIDSLVSGWSDPSIPLEMAPSIQTVPSDFDSTTFTGPSSVPGQSTTSTSVDPVTGDQIVIQSDTTINLDYSTNPLSITHNTTNVNNTYSNGVHTGSTTTTTTDTNVSTSDPLLDIPTDCEFMPTVCEWLDWTKQDLNEPDPDLSGLLNDEDFDRDFSIPLNATCPAPYPINTQLFGTVYFQWEPLCLFAEYIRYLVISGAILFAMYISLGIQRKG